MQVEKVNKNTASLNFQKMIIVKPQIWPVEVLDTFVKNKEVQEVTKAWAAEGKDLMACCLCGDCNNLVTVFKGSELAHTLWGKTVALLQKNVETFSRKDLKINRLSEREQKRLDDIERYVDTFNKSIVVKDDTPAGTMLQSKPAKNDKPSNKFQSFWEKLKRTVKMFF